MFAPLYQELHDVGGEHRALGDLVDVVAPRVLRVEVGLGAGAAVLVEVAEEVGDPADLQLDLRRIGREHAGAAGPDDDEEVRDSPRC